MSGRSQPTPACELAQRPRRFAIDHHHHLVARRRAGAARHDPARILVQVGRGVPAVWSEVGAADEGDQIVDHQHLLMMAGAIGHAGVEAEAHRSAMEPGFGAVREEVLRGADRQGALPDQDPHVQIMTALGEGLQHIADLVCGASDLVRARLQPGAWIKAPPEQKDRPASLADRREGGGEVGGAVHEEGDALRAHPPPGGLFVQDRRDGRGRCGFAGHRAPERDVAVASRMSRRDGWRRSQPPCASRRAYRMRR